MVESFVEMYDLGTVVSRRWDYEPFDLEQTVLKRVFFERVDLEEIEFEKVSLKENDSKVLLES